MDRKMSKTAAEKQAKSESSMYRQGSGWIVSTWDESVRCNQLSPEMPHSNARTVLSDWRTRRAEHLIELGEVEV